MSELSHESAKRLIHKDQLSSAELLTLRGHLRTCTACRRHTGIDGLLRQYLVLEKSSVRPSPHFSAVYLESAARRSRRSHIMRPIYAVGGAAALALLMLAGWFIIRSNIQTTGLVDAPELPAISVSEPQAALDDQLIKAVRGKDIAAVEQFLETGAAADAVDAAGNPAMYYAIIAMNVGGSADTVAMLLNNGANPDVIDGTGKSMLSLAVKNGQLEVVELLLDAGADVNTKFAIGSDDDRSPLIEAVQNNHVEIVELLIARGADVEQGESESQSQPIHYAASSDLPEMVRILLENGADLNAENVYQWTPLHWAIRWGSVKNVQALTDAGAEVNALSVKGLTPMMVLIEQGRLEGMAGKMMLLLDNGADPNLQDNSGDSALHYAARTGKLEAIPILIEYGADVTLQNNDGQTPLDVAANKQIADLLREAGATETKIYGDEEPLIGTWLNQEPGRGTKNIFTPDGKAFYYLDAANEEPDMEARYTIEETWTDREGYVFYKVLEYWSDYPYDESEVVEWYKLYMIHPSGDVFEGNWSTFQYPEEITPGRIRYHVDIRENAGATSGAQAETSAVNQELLAAVEAGDVTEVERLLDEGADPNALDDEGNALLPRAAKGGELEIVRLLLDAGADVDGTLTDAAAENETAFSHAATGGRIDVVRLLIANGADLDKAETLYNRTPLHGISWFNDAEMVRILLEAGADPDLHSTYGNGEAPLHFAVRNSSQEAVQELLAGGANGNIQTDSGVTPLMMARDSEMLTMLLEGGVNPDVQDNRGQTALHRAALANNEVFASILIEHGADVNVQNNEGQTALDVANTDQIAEILREAGAE